MSIEGQGHFFTLAQGHLHMRIKLAFHSSHWAIFSQFVGTKKMKIHQHNAGHMTKVAVIPIYGKNTLKSTFQEPLG